MRKGYKKCEYVLWYTDAACRRNSKSAIVELIDVDAKKKKSLLANVNFAS